MKPTMTADDIKALRKRTGLTQEEFAAAIGATARSVARWEKGDTDPGRMAQRAMRHFEQELDAVSSKESQDA